MSDKSSIAYGSFRAQIGSNHAQNNILWGLVSRVDAKKHIMDVDLYIGENYTTISNIQINTMMTSYGSGLRIIPKANATFALLARQSAEEWYHIGFYLDGTDVYISDKKSENEASNETPVPLRRYLDEGETQLSAIPGNEILLSNDGSILLKSQYGSYLNLDNQLSKLDGLFANLKYELDGVRIRSGNMFRPVDYDTKEEILMYEVNDTVMSEDDLTDEDEPNAQLIREFTVQVGTEQDSTTGIDDELISPSVGTLSLGTKVVDEWGNEEKVNDKSLKFLLKFKEFFSNEGESLSGLSVSYDYDGNLIILDTTTENYIKFKSSINAEDDTKQETDLTIYINKSSLNIDKDGQFTLTVENQDDSSKKTIIFVDKDGNTSISSSNEILIQGGTDSAEPSTLGTQLKTVLESMLDKIIAHTHPTGVGPSGPPANASEFTVIKTTDVPKILSKKVSNN